MGTQQGHNVAVSLVICTVHHKCERIFISNRLLQRLKNLVKGFSRPVRDGIVLRDILLQSCAFHHLFIDQERILQLLKRQRVDFAIDTVLRPDRLVDICPQLPRR